MASAATEAKCSQRSGIEAWFSRYEHYHIFFRELSTSRIGVISILHERMDLPVRLAEDLLHIAKRNADES